MLKLAKGKFPTIYGFVEHLKQVKITAHIPELGILHSGGTNQYIE